VANERKVNSDAEREQSERRRKGETGGLPPSQTTTRKATYMPSMTNLPCAKLMEFIMPQISVRPEENSA
jgi:hypothetical protein